jgi:hypothetical protein
MVIVAQTNDFTIHQFTDQSSNCVKSPSILFVCDAHGLEIRIEDGCEDLRKYDLLCLFELCGCEESRHPGIAPHVNAIHPSIRNGCPAQDPKPSEDWWMPQDGQCAYSGQSRFLPEVDRFDFV